MTVDVRVGRTPLYRVDGKHVAVLRRNRYLFVSSEFVLANGYRGPSVLGLVLDGNGVLRHVFFIESPDPEPDVQRVARELEQFLGLSTANTDARALDVTGANPTATGVRVTISRSLAALKPILEQLSFPQGPDDDENAAAPLYRGVPLEPFRVYEAPGR